MGAAWERIGATGIAVLCALAATAQRGTAGYTAQVNAGYRSLQAKKFGNAAEHFRYALTFNSSGVDAHNGLGQVYLKTGKRQRALEQFSEALKLSPHSSAAERGMHDARSDGEEERAFEELSDLANREPDNPDVQTTFAEELIERDRFSEAKTRAERALGQDNHQWHAYCALGRIAAKEGDAATARKDLQIAVSHDYTDDDALEALGGIELAAHHIDQAIRWFKKLADLLPDEAEGHELLAEAYSANGQTELAAKQRSVAEAIKSRTEGSK